MENPSTKQKLIISTVAVFFVIVCSMILSPMIFPEGINQPYKLSVDGIVVYSQHGLYNKGWIQNTNDYPVIIRYISIHHAELTQWVKSLGHGQKIQVQISPQHGFHIYHPNCTKITWIRPGVTEQPS